MIRRFGERGLLVELDGPAAAQALDESLRREPLAGVLATVPALSTVLVEMDPPGSDPEALERALSARVAALGTEPPIGRERIIPVVYGGEDGPDLGEIAALTGLGEPEIVGRHAASAVRVLFDGFAPGFAYLGDLPVDLHVARLPTPRTRTPAGSVAIAGSMTGIYPASLPGGWRVIGRTPVQLFDPLRDPPAYLVPGDRVRFVPIERGAWDAHTGAQADW